MVIRILIALITYLCVFNPGSSPGQNLKALPSYDAKDSLSITNYPLFDDSLSSSFLLLIKDEVKPHFHAHHSEHVYILEGDADILYGNEGHTIHVKAGDIMFFPAATVHAVHVTSEIPLRVLSVQSPFFDGKDRVPVDLKW